MTLRAGSKSLRSLLIWVNVAFISMTGIFSASPLLAQSTSTATSEVQEEDTQNFVFARIQRGRVTKRGMIENLQDHLETDPEFLEALRAMKKPRVRLSVRRSFIPNERKRILDAGHQMAQEITAIFREHGLEVRVEITEVKADPPDRTREEFVEGVPPADRDHRPLYSRMGRWALNSVSKTITGTPKLIFTPPLMWKAIQKPKPGEIVLGIATKAPLFAASSTAFLFAQWGHWDAVAITIASSFVLDTIFGPFAQSYTNFMNLMKKKTKFYGESVQHAWSIWFPVITAIYFREVVYNLGDSEEGAFNGEYLGKVFGGALIGFYPGNKAYQGLNRAYDTGTIDDVWRGRIQQGTRDTLFMAKETSLYLNLDFWVNAIGLEWWPILFAVEFGYNSALGVWGHMVEQRPVLHAFSMDVAGSSDYWDVMPDAFSNEVQQDTKLRQWTDRLIYGIESGWERMRQNIFEATGVSLQPFEKFNMWLADRVGCGDWFRQVWREQSALPAGAGTGP